jgi:hypothetical protein
VAYGRVVAMAYAENPPGLPDDRLRLLETIAEILVGCVNQRLNRNQPGAEVQPQSQQASQPAVAAESDQDALSRRARRVKFDTTIEILVDGVASTLVDLSVLGAQIVSPVCLRPNRRVQVALPGADGSLTCEARVVWGRVEAARAESPAMYRGGIRFADADPRAMAAFISHHSATDGDSQPDEMPAPVPHSRRQVNVRQGSALNLAESIEG